MTFVATFERHNRKLVSFSHKKRLLDIVLKAIRTDGSIVTQTTRISQFASFFRFSTVYTTVFSVITIISG